MLALKILLVDDILSLPPVFVWQESMFNYPDSATSVFELGV